jgi:hypothetical protein
LAKRKNCFPAYNTFPGEVGASHLSPTGPIPGSFYEQEEFVMSDRRIIIVFSTVHRHPWMSLRAAAFGFLRRGNLRGVEITQEREFASPKTGSQ